MAWVKPGIGGIGIGIGIGIGDHRLGLPNLDMVALQCTVTKQFAKERPNRATSTFSSTVNPISPLAHLYHFYHVATGTVIPDQVLDLDRRWLENVCDDVREQLQQRVSPLSFLQRTPYDGVPPLSHEGWENSATADVAEPGDVPPPAVASPTDLGCCAKR